MRKEMIEHEKEMKAAKEAKESGKEEDAKKAKKGKTAQTHDVRLQAFEKNTKSEDMLGHCPLKYRPIIKVTDEPSVDEKKTTTASRTRSVTSFSKPPLPGNNNDLGNLH